MTTSCCHWTLLIFDIFWKFHFQKNSTTNSCLLRTLFMFLILRLKAGLSLMSHHTQISCLNISFKKYHLNMNSKVFLKYILILSLCNSELIFFCFKTHFFMNPEFTITIHFLHRIFLISCFFVNFLKSFSVVPLISLRFYQDKCSCRTVNM